MSDTQSGLHLIDLDQPLPAPKPDARPEPATAGLYRDEPGESAGEMGPRIHALYERSEIDDVQPFLPDLRDRAFEQTPVQPDIVAALIDELKRANDAR